MTTIEVSVYNNDLVITNMPKIASGAQQSIKMKFNFNSDWNGYAKIAVFYRHEKEAYNVVVDNNNECVVPDEVLLDKGFFWFGVFGVNGVIRKTTERLKYDVEKGSFVQGSEPIDPTPDIYEQLMTIYQKTLEDYNEKYEELRIQNKNTKDQSLKTYYEVQSFKDNVSRLEVINDGSNAFSLEKGKLYQIFLTHNTSNNNFSTYIYIKATFSSGDQQYPITPTYDRYKNYVLVKVLGYESVDYSTKNIIYEIDGERLTLETTNGDISNLSLLVNQSSKVFQVNEEGYDIKALVDTTHFEQGLNEVNRIVDDKFEIDEASYETLTWTTSKLLDSSGKVIDYTAANGIDAYFAVSNYVEVEPYTRLHIIATMHYGHSLYAFYDKNKALIYNELSFNQSDYTTINKIVIVPSNAKYVIVANQQAKREAKLGVISSFKMPKVKLEDTEDIISNSFTNGTFREISLDFSIEDSFRNTITGALMEYAGAKTTELIDISSYKRLRITGGSYLSSALICFYDVLGNVISTYPSQAGTTTYKNVVIDIPSGAYYIAVNDNSGLGYLAPKIEYLYSLAPTQLKKWEGLTWACVGDSLTESNSRTTKNYHDYISEVTGISVVNMGVSGTGYKRSDSEGKAFYQRVQATPLESKVVTIFGSGNDLGSGATLGTPTDTGTNTLCGCINTTIDNLYERMPLINLGIITPTPWVSYPTSEANNAMDQYAKAIVEICKLRGIPCLDLYHCSNLRPWDETFRNLAYSKDDGNGVHPDETGHKIIASRIKAFLETLLP